MSFGGSAAAMITSLKNNKIPKRDNKLGHLEYTKGVPIGQKLEFEKKMTKEQAESFSHQLKKEKRRSAYITIFVYALILILTMTFTIIYIS